MIRQERIDVPPGLVVEIVSPSCPRSKDGLQKQQIYRDAGVRHYWIVDPEQKTLECFSLRDGTYAVVAGGMDDDQLNPPDFPELNIDPQVLWR